MIKKLKSTLGYYAKYNFLFIKELRKINQLYDSKNIEDEKNKAVSRLMLQLKQKNTFYQKFYAEHGVNLNQIQNAEDLKQLPILTKKTVKNNSSTIKSGFRLLKAKGYTSGTTGNPLVVYRDFNSIIAENAYVWWYRIQHGLNTKDKKISIRGDLDRDNLFFFDSASNTLYISSYALNKKNKNRLKARIEQFKPKAFFGYPSSLYTLALLFEESKVNFNIPLSFTSSETLLTYQEDKIKNTFNTQIFDWYGNAERTIALYRDGSNYYEPPLYSINHYQKRKVITTTLINNYFPLVNYEVNDKINTNHKFDDNKKSIIINSIEGRQEDTVILNDGTRIGRLDVVFKGVDNIKLAQIIQNKDFSVNVNIVTEIGYNSNDELKLLQNLKAKLGKSLHLKINVVAKDAIVYSKSGKFSLVKSNIESKK